MQGDTQGPRGGAGGFKFPLALLDIVTAHGDFGGLLVDK
jgi:hypothetical protein